jgi:hypothetical protein
MATGYLNSTFFGEVLVGEGQSGSPCRIILIPAKTPKKSISRGSRHHHIIETPHKKKVLHQSSLAQNLDCFYLVSCPPEETSVIKDQNNKFLTTCVSPIESSVTRENVFFSYQEFFCFHSRNI